MLGGGPALRAGVFAADRVIYAANAFAYARYSLFREVGPDTFQSPGGTYA